MTDTVATMLTAFPDTFVREVASVRDAGAVIVGPDPGLREFRRDPRTALAAVSATLRELWRNAPAPGRIAWCASGDSGTGLDAFEVSAVLGRFMSIERLQQTESAGEKHVVAIGTLREETIALSVIVPASAATESIVGWFDAMARQRAPILAWLTAGTAATLSGDTRAVEVARGFLSGAGAMGLLVPADRTAGALADPETQVTPFERLAGRRPAIVRFAAPETIESSALHRFMRITGARADASFSSADDRSAPGRPERHGPYTHSAPYRPQPFDLRVPLARADDRAWFELPHVPVAAPTLGPWWMQRQGPSDAVLADLLDAARMEAFFRLSRVSWPDERRYPEVRVYNWPSPAPASRVTLFDGGELTAGAAADLFAAVSGLAADAGPRMRVVTPDDLLQLAEREVSTRYATSTGDAITLQGEAHGYLARVPHEAPLRGDYADFARFVPAELGDALELGSGYGALAWALAPRARRYTCLDLDRRMFEALRPDLHQAGVVADMHQLPFGDDTFDSVIANNVLEHLYDPLAGLTEILRVLRPGGRLLALVPFDALNNRHELPAHHWKIDETGLRQALAASGFLIDRLDLVDIYALGVPGAFPTCFGLEGKFDALKPGGGAYAAPRAALAPMPGVAAPDTHRQLAGRLLPSVREIVGFERWAGRRVLAVGSDASDVDEFAAFGANVTRVAPDTDRWPVADSSVDLVYAFLTLPRAPLASTVAEIRRVLAPGGVVVAGFRNRNGLRYLARVRSYFGSACDLGAVAGRDALVQLADDDGARFDDEYVSAEQIERAFPGFTTREVVVRNLTRDDLAGADAAVDDRKFWQWLAAVCGRFVVLRAVK